MPKARAQRRQATLYREGERPTEQWLAKHDVEQIEAPRIEGHDHGNARTVRKVSRAVEWLRWGWLTDEQCKLLVQWEDLGDACRYDHVRSAIDMTPRGFGGGEPGARTAMARKRYDEVSKALTAKMHVQAWAVNGWLHADQRPNFMDEFGTSREAANSLARGFMREVADELNSLLKETGGVCMEPVILPQLRNAGSSLDWAFPVNIIYLRKQLQRGTGTSTGRF